MPNANLQDAIAPDHTRDRVSQRAKIAPIETEMTASSIHNTLRLAVLIVVFPGIVGCLAKGMKDNISESSVRRPASQTKQENTRKAGGIKRS